jgi:large subunit ribosomal protein L7/L12
MADEKLKKLLEQRKVLDARIRQAQSKETAEKRKIETRRKILAGAWVLDEMEQRDDFKQFVYKKLNSFLTKPDDRALFGLSPLSAPASAPVPVEGDTQSIAQ